MPCPGGHFGFSPDIPSWPVCSRPEPPRGGGHLGPHCRCEGSHQTPWAAMGCEYRARREQTPGRVSSHTGLQERRVGSSPGDTGFLASLNGLRKFIKRLYCCPGCAEVLGHASRAPFLSSHLSQHPKTERASETISLPVWDPLYNSPSSAYTPQVTRCSHPGRP